jgi:hypothetical protein
VYDDSNLVASNRLGIGSRITANTHAVIFVVGMIELTPLALSSREDAEEIYGQLVATRDDAERPLRLNLAHVSFVRVDGLLALVNVARLWNQRTHQRTTLCGMRPKVHQYLERMDLFRTCSPWIVQDQELPETERYDRLPESYRLLEIIRIDGEEQQNAKDVANAVRRAQHILTSWIGQDTYAIGQLGTILAEITSNVVHSLDHGYAVIQRYRDNDNPFFGSHIWISIADLGIGIEGSLQRYQSRLDPSVRRQLRRGSDYLIQALEMGVTTRETAGGTGLHWVRSIVTDWRGTFTIRSHRSIVSFTEDTVIRRDDLTEIPGTQVTISVRG